MGGLAWLVSSLSNRRGRAMTIVFLILLALFLRNYPAQFWPPLEKFVFLSPVHYHRPVNVLAGAGGAMWLAGGVIFARRDLCTV